MPSQHFLRCILITLFFPRSKDKSYNMFVFINKILYIRDCKADMESGIARCMSDLTALVLIWAIAQGPKGENLRKDLQSLLHNGGN